MPPGDSERSAGASDLPNTARVKIEDVKKLFLEQKGYLENFFSNVGKGVRTLSSARKRH